MWDDPRALNMIALIVAFAGVTMLGCGAVAWGVRQPVFAIHHVSIAKPLLHADSAHLEAVIREELKGTFFTMRLADARASLIGLPWVRDVSLRRQWPDRLEIDVAEHEPLARWNDSALVDTAGEVFTADYDGELPQFTGPEGSAGEITAQFRTLGSVLASTGRSIETIRRSSRGGWQIVAGGTPPLTIELGRADTANRLSRFVARYGQTIGPLARAGERVDYADLRYRDGFAARLSAADRTMKKTPRG